MKKNLILNAGGMMNRLGKLAMGLVLVAGLTTACADGKKPAAGGEKEVESDIPALKIKGAEVGYDAYKGDTSLTKVRLPETVTTVRPGAFQGCPNLTDVVLPKKMATIDADGFAENPKLENVTWPEDLKILCDKAFRDCPNLKAVTLPKNCYCVGIATFVNCTSLEKIDMTPALELVYDSAFANCSSLKSVLLPATLQKLEETAFHGCTGVEDLAIPQAMRYNIFKIFKDSKNLKNLYVLSLEHYKFPKANPIEGFPNKECKVYVRDAQVDMYRNDPTWSGFGEILPLSQSGIYDEMGMLK